MHSLLLAIVITIGCDNDAIPTVDFGTIDLGSVIYKPLSDNEGIYPDRSVLNNPNNPFIKANITFNSDTKWKIEGGAGVSDAAKYYLWATLLAKDPNGENQFYVGIALGNLGDTNRAVTAHRKVLDNFFESTTFTAGAPAGTRIFLRNQAYNELISNGVTPFEIAEWGYVVAGANVERI